MPDTLFLITDGSATTEQLLYLNNMVLSALKYAPDLVTLTRSIDALASVISIKVDITNTTLTKFAGGKVVKRQKQKTNSAKLIGYHKFRHLVKPLVMNIFPGASIAEINKYASMVWSNVSAEVKTDWHTHCVAQIDDQEGNNAAEWVTHFQGILNTLFEDNENNEGDAGYEIDDSSEDM